MVVYLQLMFLPLSFLTCQTASVSCLWSTFEYKLCSESADRSRMLKWLNASSVMRSCLELWAAGQTKCLSLIKSPIIPENTESREKVKFWQSEKNVLIYPVASLLLMNTWLCLTSWSFHKFTSVWSFDCLIMQSTVGMSGFASSTFLRWAGLINRF